MNVVTAGGSAVDPPLLTIEPERSNTNDITSLPRVAWALSLTEKVFRLGEGDPWSFRRKRSIGHDVAMERFHIGYAGIFTATASVGPALIVGLRLQCDAKSFDAGWITSFTEDYSRNAYARVIPFRDQPGEQV